MNQVRHVKSSHYYSSSFPTIPQAKNHTHSGGNHLHGSGMEDVVDIIVPTVADNLIFQQLPTPLPQQQHPSLYLAFFGSMWGYSWPNKACNIPKIPRKNFILIKSKPFMH